MRRRLYFLLPNLGSAIKTANDLLLARVEDGHMHFLAKRGMSLGRLHEANTLQKSDCVHGAELGFVLGGAGGFLIGIYIYLTPPDGVTLQLVTVLISTVIGAVFGAWASSLLAMLAPTAPCDSFCLTASADWSYAIMRWPRFMRRKTMLPPMRPRPTIPISMVIPSGAWLLDLAPRTQRLRLEFAGTPADLTAAANAFHPAAASLPSVTRSKGR